MVKLKAIGLLLIRHKTDQLIGSVEPSNYVCVNFSFSYAVNTYNDELIAIELEIDEINKETNRLRRRRCQLLDRQKELKEMIKGNQQSMAKPVDQWGRTSRKN